MGPPQPPVLVSLSLTLSLHTQSNYAALAGNKTPLPWPPTLVRFNHIAGIVYRWRTADCNPVSAATVLLSMREPDGRSHGSDCVMEASGNHEGNSRHCRPARASPMSCETTPFSTNSLSLPPPLILLRSSPTTHAAIPRLMSVFGRLIV